ncbi:MAG TPA: glycerophosphodiester phosphodiesterase family protein [Acidiferrobacter sp.]|nr:glycerophosphodiester phosphodiesterase family protein [Acidiferrobacter sp.]
MVELIAHRGYAYRFPENTLVALEAAVAAGARYVEVDVQLTSDKVPILFHDHDCLRLCGVPGTVDERSYTAIRNLRAAWPARFGDLFRDNPLTSLAELAEFLARHPGVTAFVEIKRQAVKRFGAKAVVEASHATLRAVLSQTVAISYSLPALKVARKLFPRIGFVSDSYLPFQSRSVQALAPEFHFCDLKGLPPQGALARADRILAVYEVDDAACARDLGARGVGLVETFQIAELRSALAALTP